MKGTFSDHHIAEQYYSYADALGIVTPKPQSCAMFCPEIAQLPMSIFIFMEMQDDASVLIQFKPTPSCPGRKLSGNQTHVHLL